MKTKKEQMTPGMENKTPAGGNGPFRDLPPGTQWCVGLIVSFVGACLVPALTAPEDKTALIVLVMLAVIALICLIAMKRKWPGILMLVVLAAVAGYIFWPGCDCGLCQRNDFEVGDVVFFGSYYQSGTQEKEPLPWTVLEAGEDRLVLITQDCVDAQQFHPYDDPACSWQTSALRTWLNRDFLSAVFNDREQKHLLPVIAPEQDKAYVISGERPESDSVFLLSFKEYREYFPNKADAAAYPTVYALEQGAGCDSDLPGSPGWWWLRSRGEENFRTMNVKSGGSVNTTGNRVSNVSLSIRPVIIVECR